MEALARLPGIRDARVAKTDNHDPDCECHVGEVLVCLGPGRCETLGKQGGCDWCLRYPTCEGADYADTMFRILDTGH